MKNRLRDKQLYREECEAKVRKEIALATANLIRLRRAQTLTFFLLETLSLTFYALERAERWIQRLEECA